MNDKEITRGKSIFILLLALIILLYGVIKLEANPAICLILSALSAIYLGMFFGNKWELFERDIGETIQKMFVGMLIMMFVGILIGAWMASGTIPLLMYYGLKFLPPNIFLVATCLLCAVMSLTTGTSWGTIGTIGVALIGVSEGIGIPIPYTAGAIVVGAIFGDKLSPLSDTTIIASYVSDVNIIEHMKTMLYTTLPSLAVSLVLYFILGLKYSGSSINQGDYNLILETLQSNFNLNPLLLIPPIIVLTLIIMRKPTIPVFGVGILSALPLAMVFQKMQLNEVLGAFFNGLQMNTDVALVDQMINRGGLASMMTSVALIIGAALFSASLKTNNVFDIFLEFVEKYTRGRKSLLVFSYALHLILASLTGVYLVTFAIVGPMLAPLFDKFNLHKKNLSRMLEDTGTAFSPIIPWSNISIFIFGTLGVSSFDYVLYAPITYLSLVFALIYIFTGFGIFDSEGNMVYKTNIR